jgi:hypothetical protein
MTTYDLAWKRAEKELATILVAHGLGDEKAKEIAKLKVNAAVVEKLATPLVRLNRAV